MMRLTQDLKSARWIYAKGFLFVLISITAGGLLIARAPRVDIVLVLLVCLWAGCGAYYFAFYVIQHYVDPSYRYSGLFDFANYVLFRRQVERTDGPGENDRAD